MEYAARGNNVKILNIVLYLNDRATGRATIIFAFFLRVFFYSIVTDVVFISDIKFIPCCCDTIALLRELVISINTKRGWDNKKLKTQCPKNYEKKPIIYLLLHWL